MRFEESQYRRKQGGVGSPATQFLCVDSGQVEEPLSTAFVRQSDGQCG